MLALVCRTMEIIEEGVSLLENLERRRQPMPGMQVCEVMTCVEDEWECGVRRSTSFTRMRILSRR